MATYKVPQDVEAADKLLGPLTFKQFIFLMIAAGAALISWALFQVAPLLSLIPVPVILIFGGLAVFRREDQPVERYLLSFFNFMLRPRQRLWNPEGYYEHLVITPEKKTAPPPLKQDIGQVQGQLEKLAQVVDSRGWATRNPDITMPNNSMAGSSEDDRLFMPQQPEDPEAVPEDEDIMDEHNPKTQQIESMLQQSTEQQREKLVSEMKHAIEEGAAAHASLTPKHELQIAPPGSEAKDTSPQQTQEIEPNAEQTTQEQRPNQAQQPDQTENGSAILESLPTEDLSVSQVAVAANRKREDDNSLQEGEEIRLR